MKLSKTLYYQRKEQGLCVRCGEKAIQGKVMCETCRDNEAKKRKSDREFCKSMGICPRCQKNLLWGDEKNCPECLAKMQIVNEKYKNRGNFNSKEYHKKRYEQLKESGYCIKCRKRLQEQGKTKCSVCLASERLRMRKQGIPRSERVNYGLCYFCGNKLDRVGRCCTSCAERNSKNIEGVFGGEEWKNSNKKFYKVGGF